MECSLFNSFLLIVVCDHTCAYMGGTRHGTPGLDTRYEKGGGSNPTQHSRSSGRRININMAPVWTID